MNKHILVFFLFFFFLSAKDSSKQKNNIKLLGLPWALPLGAEIGVDVALLVKLLGQLEHFLFTCITLSFKGIPLFFKPNPGSLQVFQISRHVRMENSIGYVTYSNRFHNYGYNRREWHHEVLSSSSHPFEVRLPRSGILVPQSLGISLLYHAPSMYEPSTVILEIVVVVEHNVLKKHIMRTISSSKTKLT